MAFASWWEENGCPDGAPGCAKAKFYAQEAMATALNEMECQVAELASRLAVPTKVKMTEDQAW